MSKLIGPYGTVTLLRAKLNFKGKQWDSWVEELDAYAEWKVEKQVVIWENDLPKIVIDYVNVYGTMMPIRVFYPLVTNPTAPPPRKLIFMDRRGVVSEHG